MPVAFRPHPCLRLRWRLLLMSARAALTYSAMLPQLPPIRGHFDSYLEEGANYLPSNAKISQIQNAIYFVFKCLAKSTERGATNDAVLRPFIFQNGDGVRRLYAS
ncbi:uncharacterized protein PHALS_09580 [Plasmopara halstedii]|uniref:RxLR-like protein n=1 Tax=Plasmopara halstedii TaxID=4781 RepID=A0A0P1AEE4_PLAHL|nr:uncharacterized protein PHALS_09580 [Plasmopara halstedii]CEG39326.1 hypothetical protein PHALS_09580 [Plasmopara halstedii]|eukprot:XP_024575695.1 hypothetical protein PHALS_09580 [Plasmopara halstedii]